MVELSWIQWGARKSLGRFRTARDTGQGDEQVRALAIAMSRRSSRSTGSDAGAGGSAQIGNSRADGQISLHPKL